MGNGSSINNGSIGFKSVEPFRFKGLVRRSTSSVSLNFCFNPLKWIPVVDYGDAVRGSGRQVAQQFLRPPALCGTNSLYIFLYITIYVIVYTLLNNYMSFFLLLWLSRIEKDSKLLFWRVKVSASEFMSGFQDF